MVGAAIAVALGSLIAGPLPSDPSGETLYIGRIEGAGTCRKPPPDANFVYPYCKLP
jgi:hypothetical protein